MHKEIVRSRSIKSASTTLIAVLLSVSLIVSRFAIGGDAVDADSMEKNKKAKNVILIQTDHELSRADEDKSEYYAIQRPNYERFKEEAVTFVNAKCVTPLCSPARRTMLTGVYPNEHGIINNETSIMPSAESLTIYDVLLENGFDTDNIYFFGKTHYSAGLSGDTATATYGISGWSIGGYGQPYTKAEYKNYLKRNNYFGSTYKTPVMRMIAEQLNDTPNLVEGDLKDLSEMRLITGHLYGVLETPKEFHETYFLADMVVSQLEEIAKSGNDEPFIMSVNMWGPHHPCSPTQEFIDLYTDENGVIGGNIPEYPSFADDWDNLPAVYAWDNQSTVDPGLETPNSLSWETFRTYLAIAYASATMTDDAIGRILDAIDELGFDENTVVIWTADHGDALAAHGGHSGKECYMIEEVLDITMMVKSPDHTELAGTFNYSFVNTADVPVTMLDVLGLSFPERVAGMSMLDLLDGTADPRTYMVSQTNGLSSETHARTVYYKNFKFTYTMCDIDEFYDLEEDPYEMNNLIFDDAHQGIITLMKDMLREWQIEEGDIIPLIE